jgi:hypothetical protein
MNWTAVVIVAMGAGIMAVLQICLSDIRNELSGLAEVMHQAGEAVREEQAQRDRLASRVERLELRSGT